MLTDVLISGSPFGDSLAVANNSCTAWDVKEDHFLEAEDTISVVLKRSFAQSQRLIVGARLGLADAEYPFAEIISCITCAHRSRHAKGLSGDRSSGDSEAVRREGFIWIVV